MNVVHEVERAAAQRAAVETLIREHRNIEMLLVMLDSYFAAMSAGDDVDETLLVDAMTYMTEYVDGFHHNKEQLAVDVVAERSPAIADAKAELEAQHRRIGQAGAWLRATLEQVVLRDAPVSRQKLIATGLTYTAEMRRNMELEERLVFPALTAGLDADAWRVIEARMPPQPDPLFGEAVHQRYAELFRELVERFGLEGEALYE
jgi:branched-chain amino acid transport system ATP-binding protein